jgi:hypothetical protein
MDTTNANCSNCKTTTRGNRCIINTVRVHVVQARTQRINPMLRSVTPAQQAFVNKAGVLNHTAALAFTRTKTKP